MEKSNSVKNPIALGVKLMRDDEGVKVMLPCISNWLEALCI